MVNSYARASEFPGWPKGLKTQKQTKNKPIIHQIKTKEKGKRREEEEGERIAF